MTQGHVHGNTLGGAITVAEGDGPSVVILSSPTRSKICFPPIDFLLCLTYIGYGRFIP